MLLLHLKNQHLIPSLKIVSFQKTTIKTTKGCNTADKEATSDHSNTFKWWNPFNYTLYAGFQRPGYSPPFIQGHFMDSINFT